MMSLVIPTPDDDPALLETLAALVSGVAEGLLRDAVIIGPRSPRIDEMAEAAGAQRLISEGAREVAIGEAARSARAEFCLVLSAGLVPEGAWIPALADGMRVLTQPHNAGFMPLIAGQSANGRLKAAVLNYKAVLTGRPDPRHGLLVTRAALRAGVRRFQLFRLAAGVKDHLINRQSP